jgi:hypothetical protein
MRTILATLAVAAIVSLGATAATAAPSRSATLTPAEMKWATPVVALWNNLNSALLKVVTQAGAKDALIVGTKNNGKLNATLAVFVTCSKNLRKPGAAPARLAIVAASMKKACTQVEAGGHGFARAIGAIYQGNSTLGQKLIVQSYGELQKGSKTLATARTQLLAAGGNTR